MSAQISVTISGTNGLKGGTFSLTVEGEINVGDNPAYYAAALETALASASRGLVEQVEKLYGRSS